MSELLSPLREWMRERTLDAFIVPSADPHLSEYVPDHFKCRGAISGFSGSAGTVVVTNDWAGLWTDGRYFLEAARALAGSPIALMKMTGREEDTYSAWLGSNAQDGWRVGVDGRLVSSEDFRSLATRLRRHGAELVAADDPFAAIWRGRPALPASEIWPVDPDVSGFTRSETLARVRGALNAHGAATAIISTLDDVAWTLNSRGFDVAYNPVFLAHLAVTRTGAIVWTEGERIPPTLLAAWRADGIEVRPYDAFSRDVPTLPSPLLLDPSRLSQATFQLRREADIVEADVPTVMMKACKNGRQQDLIRETMAYDGVAVVRALWWVADRVAAGEPVDEFDLATRLHELRARHSAFLGDSFETIAGSGPNGAVIHYAADPKTARTIGVGDVVLLDSGGHYRTGTTDITRTVAIGAVDSVVVRDYTRVLKGHIALARLVFPAGASGRDIDAVARAPIWTDGINYAHGTGHGVGFLLNVHEGPARIAPAAAAVPLEEGMLISNEPGIYREGAWGIRLENLVLVQRAGRHPDGDDGVRFLAFETVTLCPFDRSLIDVAALTDPERVWLDAYHQRVCARLEPLLEDDGERERLGAMCAPLTAAE